MKISFADIEIDTALFELRRHGELIHVEPKVFNLLVYLSQNPDKVISSDELIEAVWQGRIVSDTTVSSCIKNARKAIGDSGADQALIKTIRGRGYRFCATVDGGTPAQNIEKPSTEKSTTHSRAVSSDTGRFRPSLVIQPLLAIGDLSELKSFSQGLTYSLCTALNRIPLLRIAAATGPFSESPAQEIRRELSADYLLSGSVEAVDGVTKMSIQLCETRKGFNLWAQRFDVPGTPANARESCVLAILAKLEPQLYRAIYEEVRSLDYDNSAEELYLEASSMLALKGWHHDSFGKASSLLRKSWHLSPEFAHAPGYLSLVLGLGHRLGLMKDADRAREEALEAAEKSLELENMDSSIMGLAGCALGDLGYGSRALAILRQAVELNPDNGQASAALGAVCLAERRLDEAIKHLQHGMSISPLDSRLSVWGSVLATALRVSGDLDSARQQAELACQRDLRCYMPRVVLAAVLREMSEPSTATEAIKDAFRIKPDLTEKQIAYLVGQRLGRGLATLV